jgi:hypothetical protein
MASTGESGPLADLAAESPPEPKELVDIGARLVCYASTGAHTRSEEQARTRRDHASDAS